MSASAIDASGTLASLAAHTGYASVARIDVDAPVEVVWPVVVDMAAWITDFAFQQVAGNHGAVGEVRHLWPNGAEGLGISAERTLETATVMKTIAAVPGVMWFAVTPLAPKNGVASSAANILLLDDLGRRTRVTAIRSKEFLCPDEASAAAIAAKSEAYQPTAQARWTETYLPRLKALAEQARR